MIFQYEIKFNLNVFFQPKEIEFRLKNYDKFIFVRNPAERILSAFRNKFEKNYTTSLHFQKIYGSKIIRNYRNKKYKGNGSGVKYGEFLSYLIDSSKYEPNKMNEHWAPFNNLCHPCDIK